MKQHKKTAEELLRYITYEDDPKDAINIIISKYDIDLLELISVNKEEILHMLTDVIDQGIIKEAPEDIQEDVKALDKLFDDPLKQLGHTLTLKILNNEERII